MERSDEEGQAQESSRGSVEQVRGLVKSEAKKRANKEKGRKGGSSKAARRPRRRDAQRPRPGRRKKPSTS